MITEIYRQGKDAVRKVQALGPTEREDGTPLGVAEIDHYNRYLSFNGGVLLQMKVQLIENANTPEYDGAFDEVIYIDDQAAGTYVYYYTTVDKDGQESAPSESITLEILPPLAVPNPPTNLATAEV